MKSQSSVKSWNAFFLSCLALSIGIIYRKESGDWPYVLLLVGAVGAIGLFLLKKNQKIVLFLGASNSVLRKRSLAFKYLNVCWIFIFASWIYGVAVGFINSNATENIFRNFFGLNLYFLMPLLFTLKPKKSHLFIAVATGCAAQCVIAVYELSQSGLNFNIVSSLSDARVFYSVGLIAALPIFSYYISSLFFPLKKTPFEDKRRSFYFYAFCALALSFFIIVPPASKGFILAWVAATFYVITLFYIKLASGFRISINGILISVLIICVAVAIFYIFGEILIYSYSSQEISNATRSEQFFIIAEDINFMGRGLGALLSSGYVRDETGYGMELTYLNIAHKLGFFSVFIFLSYLATYYAAFKIGIKSGRVHESCFSFGGLGFCIIGAGNPLLLGPTAVALHCVIMYIILMEISDGE